MGEPGLYGKRLRRRRTTASVREDGMAQICADSFALMKTASLAIGQIYFYTKDPQSLPNWEL